MPGWACALDFSGPHAWGWGLVLRKFSVSEQMFHGAGSMSISPHFPRLIPHVQNWVLMKRFVVPPLSPGLSCLTRGI